MLLPFPTDHRTDALSFRDSQRANEEIRALERRQPRHHEDVVAVAVTPIGPLRRRRIEHRRRQLRPHLQPRLDGSRLDEQPRHVPSQQIPVGGVQRPPPEAFLEPILRAEPGAEAIPQIVILAHRVVEPADVMRMPHGVARVAEADDLIDRVAGALTDVGQPGRDVSRGLAAEPVLRRDDDVGLVAGVAQRLSERTRDHHVTTLDERRAGCDDSDPAHTLPSSMKTETSPLRNASRKRLGRERSVASKSGNILRSGGPTRR